MWLETPVEERDDAGRCRRTTRNKDEGWGPRKGLRSPVVGEHLHASLCAGLEAGGHERRLGARIVNYADDFVICCRGTAAEAMTVMRGMMSKLKLTVNETKTRACRVPEETFDFLGHTFGRNYHRQTGEAYLGPSRRGRRSSGLPRDQRDDRPEEDVDSRRGASGPDQSEAERLDQLLPGGDGEPGLWGGEPPRDVPAPPTVVCQAQGPGPGIFTLPGPLSVPDPGAVPAPACRTRPTVSARVNRLVREPGAGNPPARFDERGVETGHGRDGGTPAVRKGGPTGENKLRPKLPRHTSTLLIFRFASGG